VLRQQTDLPIEAASAAISSAIGEGSLVLTAEPGAGKSSIVPLLAAACTEQRVVVLEPRRLAARATASRLSSLLSECGGVGDLVGLTIRGERKVSARTRIEVVTEAVLTARLQRDAELPGVGVVVFDEFHERNLHSDLGLAMALESRASIRPDLALVVMSATLDPAPVARLLETSNIIEVPGRTFPVETTYLVRPDQRTWATAVARAAVEALHQIEGDVLAFVPGRREIGQVERTIRSALASSSSAAQCEVIGLHGGSNANVQRAVLDHGRGRRIIVATSVAETSVTLPGIEAVVDGGLLRRARYDALTGLGRLETVQVTRFAADQRRGRAGRLRPGMCFRLWSPDDHRHLDDSVPPEIVDGDPLPVTFELARWGDPQGLGLPLLDHPGSERLAAGRSLLAKLELVDDTGSLTAAGRAAASLGVHPRLGRLLLTAAGTGDPKLGLLAAALLDGDRWPDTPDLAAEIDRRRNELGRSTTRLRRRLEKATPKAKRPTSAETGSPDPSDLGSLLATAWPDRVAMARPTRPGHFLLATGREVVVKDGPMAAAEFLVIAEADGMARAANARRVAVIDRATVLDQLSKHVEWVDHVDWDERTDSLRAERQQKLGSIVLHTSPLLEPDPAAVQAGLARGLRRRGLDVLRWTERGEELRHRLRWLHEQQPSDWPAMDERTLLDRIEEWLDLTLCRSPADIRRLQIDRQLSALLPWNQQNEVDRLAPTQLPLPRGGSRRVDYSSGRPTWAVRLQDVFGLDVHPVMGPHRQPVTIELLSPANRPAQVTNDLPGFWRGSYAAVRSDLRGRYPKHAWPEQPWTE
jgi:ATP-dependent helicase HrpB